jgi:hypothetical protein
MSDKYGHVPAETVNQAVEDKANGNRPLLSTGVLQRRIHEIQYDRAIRHEDFLMFVKKHMTRVKQ